MAQNSQGSGKFSFESFKRRLSDETFIRGQDGPLKMRLDLMESFLEESPYGRHPSGKYSEETAWKFEKGSLTIIDLSCPFVDESAACSLFNICLDIFLEERNASGRIIALDEAHKVRTSKFLFPSH